MSKKPIKNRQAQLLPEDYFDRVEAIYGLKFEFDFSDLGDAIALDVLAAGKGGVQVEVATFVFSNIDNVVPPDDIREIVVDLWLGFVYHLQRATADKRHFPRKCDDFTCEIETNGEISCVCVYRDGNLVATGWYPVARLPKATPRVKMIICDMYKFLFDLVEVPF